MIAQGLVAAYEEGKPVSPEMLKMALARLRQLSAHEVGHTIGLSHNFAASTNDRSSVMDYPHPYITLNSNGTLNFENAYDDKIGAWDKRTVLYGYQDFPKGTDEAKALLEILNENDRMGLRYISDRDARPQGGAHPYAHLWDNGKNPVSELERMMKVRATALKTFGENNIPMNAPMSTLEEVLVPLYLAHRYQVEGTIKMIGGVEYSYSTRGQANTDVKPLATHEQKNAIAAVMQTLQSEQLAIPEHILKLIPPKAFGYDRGRESFKTRTGLTLDPMAAAESAANHIIGLYLNPQRAARLIEQNAMNSNYPGFHDAVNILLESTWYIEDKNNYHAAIGRVTEKMVLQHLMKTAVNESANEQVRAIAFLKINELKDRLSKKTSGKDVENAHVQHALFLINQFVQNPNEWKSAMPKDMPDGSPIGSDACSH